MKRTWLIITIIAVFIFASAAAVWASEPIKLIVNGQEIKPDVAPQIINNRTMVPVRWIAEALGAHVEWDPQTQTVRIITNGDITDNQDNNDQTAVTKLVQEFGQRLKNVSLTAAEETIINSVTENYGDLVSAELLSKWQNYPATAPGRLTSSPWPERIEISETKKLSDSKYKIKGEIIEVTSVEMANGGYASKQPVILLVEKTDNNWLITSFRYDFTNSAHLSEKGIIKPELAEKIIKESADKVIYAVSTKDAATIAEYTHPVKGVRFTPYTYVSIENDVVFSKEAVKTFFTDQKTYLWGYYDGIGDEIKLTPSQYYQKFIYNVDYINADEIGYNEVLSSGNALENQFEVYENAIVVEYYFPGFTPEYDGLDWKSLRLVFEPYGNDWKLVGIISNQWTI